MDSKAIEREHLLMLIMAAAIILFNVVGFIVCYFVWRELSKDSNYIYRNGRNLLNFHISFIIYEFLAGLSIIVVIGAFLLPIVSIAYLVLTIIGMIKYGLNEDYQYPFIIRFIK